MAATNNDNNLLTVKREVIKLCAVNEIAIKNDHTKISKKLNLLNASITKTKSATSLDVSIQNLAVVTAIKIKSELKQLKVIPSVQKEIQESIQCSVDIIEIQGSNSLDITQKFYCDVSNNVIDSNFTHIGLIVFGFIPSNNPQYAKLISVGHCEEWKTKNATKFNENIVKNYLLHQMLKTLALNSNCSKNYDNDDEKDSNTQLKLSVFNKSHARKTKRVYRNREIYMSSFISLIQSNKWKYDTSYNPPTDMVTHYMKEDKYGIPIARAIVRIRSPKKSIIDLFNILNDDYGIDKLEKMVCPSQIRYKFSDCTKIVQFQVAATTAKNNLLFSISNRDWLVYHCPFLVDSNYNILRNNYKIRDGKVYKLNDINYISAINVKLIFIMRSIHKNEKKYYHKSAQNDARGILYRSGTVVEQLNDGTLRATAIHEMDIGGTFICRGYWNSTVHSIKNCIELATKTKKFMSS